FRQTEASSPFSRTLRWPSKNMRVDLGEVIVPVLSNTIQSILAIFSTTAVFLIYILFRSKMLNAAESVKGELSANAHGHAMINTAVNAFHALAVSPPNSQ